MSTRPSTASLVFNTLHRSGGMGSDPTSAPRASWPLKWCTKHKLHHSGVPGAYAYCEYVDPMRAAAVRERDRQERDAARKGSMLSAGALAKMGLE